MIYEEPATTEITTMSTTRRGLPITRSRIVINRINSYLWERGLEIDYFTMLLGYNERQCTHRTIIIKYAQSSIMKKLLITRHSPAYWRVTFDNPPLNLIDPHLLLSRRMLPSTWQAVWQLILYHLPRHELESADVLIILVSFVVSNLHPIQEC